MMFRRTAVHSLILAALLGLVAAPAAAQRGSPAGPRPGGHVAGVFDYYALVLSWSPSYCADRQRPGDELQCDRRDGRRYAFVLHGLWPQYERGYPEYCATRDRPFVPQDVINHMLDIMPSPRLVIHEYRRHGTCSALGAAEYFELSRNLFTKLKIPAPYVDPVRPLFVAPSELAHEFVAANPSLKPEMIAIECRGPGNRLRAVRICYTREGDFRACGANEDQRRLCAAGKMYVPPVRAGAGPDRLPPHGAPPRQ
jgi:ribonuclease T2